MSKVLGALCECEARGQMSVVAFGSRHPQPDLPALVHLRDRGHPWWWLYESHCSACGAFWLVAQEERFNDVYILRRLSIAEAHAIESEGVWPTDLNQYETLLRIGAQAGHQARFVEPREGTLQAIVEDMLRDRPLITAEEVASLINVEEEEGLWLLSAAKSHLGAG